jgi:hypothetical protein
MSTTLKKDDPLFSYMHHARNSDEHGIEPVAMDLPQSTDPISQYGYLISVFLNDGQPVSAVFKG